ncbi:MAG: HIT family protein [Chloroflexi bacterium]|nr:MAG: HIT family protein [Chloroflexota bacterium]
MTSSPPSWTIEHTVLLGETPQGTRDLLFAAAVALGEAARASSFEPAGINLFVADGEAAGQEVPHVHVHVIPRFPGDGFTVDALAWRSPRPARDVLDQHAATLRNAFAGYSRQA